MAKASLTDNGHTRVSTCVRGAAMPYPPVCRPRQEQSERGRLCVHPQASGRGAQPEAFGLNWPSPSQTGEPWRVHGGATVPAPCAHSGSPSVTCERPAPRTEGRSPRATRDFSVLQRRRRGKAETAPGCVSRAGDRKPDNCRSLKSFQSQKVFGKVPF